MNTCILLYSMLSRKKIKKETQVIQNIFHHCLGKHENIYIYIYVLISITRSLLIKVYLTGRSVAGSKCLIGLL